MKTTHDWLEERSTGETLHILEGFTSALAARCGEVGQYLLGLVQEGRFADLLAYKIDYNAEWDVSHLIAVRQILALYSKLPTLPVRDAHEREMAAYDNLCETEVNCLQTNNRFRSKTGVPDGFSPTTYAQLLRAKKLIRTILGPVPRLSQLKLSFGPGATTTVKKESACPQMKLAGRPTCSDELANSPWLNSFLRTIPHWLNEHTSTWSMDENGGLFSEIMLDLSPSKLVAVPKNAVIDRFIEIQPTLNTLLQLGLGKWIEGRLRSVVGLDIRNQELNQQLARVGSLTGLIQTLDLKSASATIARMLVRFLFPEEWYQLLMHAGCRDTFYRGHHIRLEMFCSMGNGFTFPLETLIFYALTFAACGGKSDNVRAYGDDIICPSEFEGDVRELLTACGFMINESKCGYGPFRESCGADYYKGFNIRPVYVKNNMSAEQLYVIHNFFARSYDTELAEMALQCIPTELRLFGPDGYGDGVLVGTSDWTRFKNRAQRRSGYGGVSFEMFRRLDLTKVSIYPGDYVSPLYSVYTRAESLQDLLASTSPHGDHDRDYPLQSFRRWQYRISTRHIGSNPFSITRSQDWVNSSYLVSPSTQQLYALDKSGKPDIRRPLWSVPGSNGFERVLIYTLEA